MNAEPGRFYWKWLANASKAHVFSETDGRSLCGRWLHLGRAGDDSQHMGSEPGNNDCKVCFRKFAKILEEAMNDASD